MNQNEKRMILTSVQKPGRYAGGEYGQVIKDRAAVSARFAFCFPDTYEIGMSNLGVRILYHCLNLHERIWCERVYDPWVDMQEKMKEYDLPLTAVESGDSLSVFDFIGFTLQYEMSYTNVLNMLELGRVPIWARERGEHDPLVIGGGPCSYNPEPVADFFDLFNIGEGEEMLPEIVELYIAMRDEGSYTRAAFLHRAAATIPGVYVPSLYDVTYHEDGRVKAITPNDPAAPAVITKAVIRDMDSQTPPTHFVVPMVGAVHDRAQIEVLRGCGRGCRFCQAGFLYRPMRQRSADKLNEAAHRLCDNTGYEEISLTSLSTSDHSQLEPLLDDLLTWTKDEHVSLSLPSLRIDNFSESLIEKTNRVRKTGLTFAPEAGTQRLRDVINKNVTWPEIERTCTLAFKAGYTSVKLYFMMGLPTETMEDIEGIADTAQKVVDLYYANPDKPKGKSVQVTISVACFVPKPHTPFQFVPQDTEAQLKEKQQHLLHSVHSKKIHVNYHDSSISFLEAVFAKGDRRLGRVLEAAYRKGCFFDGWDEYFHYDRWMEAFAECGLDTAFYANRFIGLDEVTPWSHMDYGVSHDFLVREYQKAMAAQTTPPCNRKCSACGANKFVGGACFDYSKDLVH